MFSTPSFTEERVEVILSGPNGLITWHLAIWLDTVLKTEQFPAGITNLDTGLTDVEGDHFTLSIEMTKNMVEMFTKRTGLQLLIRDMKVKTYPKYGENKQTIRDQPFTKKKEVQNFD